MNTDFVDQPVPLRHRRSPWHVAFVWAGFIIVVGIMAVGGGMVPLMDRDELLASILIGNIILGLFAAFSGYIASRTGMSFSQLAAQAFPGRSWRLATLYPPLTIIGWYAIECAIFGNLLGAAFGLGPVMTRIAMALSAVGFAVTTYIGFEAIKWASVVLVPLIIGLGAYAVFLILGGDSLATFGGGANPIGFGGGLGLVIGSWALGVVVAYPDIARFCRSPIIAAAIGFFGILILNSLTLLMGVAGAAFTGQYDPALILIGLGVVPVALIFGIANLWTTNDSNLYSASLNLARLMNWSRQKAVVVSAGLGLIVAAFDPSQFAVFFTFLGFLGNTSPALGGVVFGAYVVSQRLEHKRVGVIGAWAGWIGGSIVSALVPTLLAVPLGFVAGFAIWFLFTPSSLDLQQVSES